MNLMIGLTLLSCATLAADGDAPSDKPFAISVDLVARVERTELLIGGNVRPRIDRDEAGEIKRLMLDEMRLSAEEFLALEGLTSLKYLSLRATNVTSADLVHLRELPKLDYLVLTATEVDDDAVAPLRQIPALKTLCLGNVPMSSAAVNELKQHRPRISIGHSQRQP